MFFCFFFNALDLNGFNKRKVGSWKREVGSAKLGDGSRNQQTLCSEKFRHSPDCNENTFSFFFNKEKDCNGKLERASEN